MNILKDIGKYSADDSKQKSVNVLQEAASALNYNGAFYTEPTSSGQDGAYLHHYPRLVIFLDGDSETYLCQNEERFSINASRGDSLFIVKNGWLPHPVPKSKYTRALSFIFYPEYTRVLEWDSTGEEPKPLKRVWWYHTSRPLPGGGQNILKSINCFIDSGHYMPSAPYLIKALLLSLIDHIETDTPAGRGSKSKQTFLELTTYLRENFAQEITRTEIAKVFHLHPNHISRIFKKEGNISFANYLSQLRIEFAKQMLAQEKALTIEEIAYRCGFSSSSYFGKSFRRYTGTSPLQFLNCLNHS